MPRLLSSARGTRSPGQWPSTADQEGFEYLSLWVGTLQKALLRLADEVERRQVPPEA